MIHKLQLQQGTIMLAAVLLVFSCSVRLIAPYDEVTDRNVARLQESVSLTFKRWQREVPNFEDTRSFYDETEVLLDILIDRNEAVEKSDIIVRMLKNVRENVATIKSLHEEGQLSGEVLEQIAPDITSQLTAIQKFQMSLKTASEND